MNSFTRSLEHQMDYAFVDILFDVCHIEWHETIT